MSLRVFLQRGLVQMGQVLKRDLLLKQHLLIPLRLPPMFLLLMLGQVVCPPQIMAAILPDVQTNQLEDNQQVLH